eukprot:3935740-Rhodomonas_salina.3
MRLREKGKSTELCCAWSSPHALSAVHPTVLPAPRTHGLSSSTHHTRLRATQRREVRRGDGGGGEYALGLGGEHGGEELDGGVGEAVVAEVHVLEALVQLQRLRHHPHPLVLHPAPRHVQLLQAVAPLQHVRQVHRPLRPQLVVRQVQGRHRPHPCPPRPSVTTTLPARTCRGAEAAYAGPRAVKRGGASRLRRSPSTAGPAAGAPASPVRPSSVPGSA